MLHTVSILVCPRNFSTGSALGTVMNYLINKKYFKDKSRTY